MSRYRRAFFTFFARARSRRERKGARRPARFCWASLGRGWYCRAAAAFDSGGGASIRVPAAGVIIDVITWLSENAGLAG